MNWRIKPPILLVRPRLCCAALRVHVLPVGKGMDFRVPTGQCPSVIYSTFGSAR